MSSDNNIPKPVKDGLKSLYKETAQETMEIALRELLALGDFMMVLDLTNEESLVNYARQAERANQVIGFISNKLTRDRGAVDAALSCLGAPESLAHKLTDAGQEGADDIRAEVSGVLMELQAKYARLLEEAVASINNGSDN